MLKNTRHWLMAGMVGGSMVSANLLADATMDPNVEAVAVRRFDVAFEIANADEEDTVTLWHSSDQGATWSRGDSVPATDEKVTFSADRDGLYGFRLAVNWGNVAPGNDAETFWTWVDGSPPVLQLHPLTVENEATVRPVVLVRWTAIDAGLVDRPVSLSYRSGLEGSWMGIEAAVANTGSYDWRVPEGVTGEVTVRVRCADRAGHVSSAVGVLTIADRRAVEVPARRGLSRPAQAFAGTGFEADVDGRSTISAADQDRADELFNLAKGHADRAEYRLAASRLRDVLAIDPNRTEALVTLGGVLYAQGKGGEALEAFELALTQRPDSYEALEGSASVYIGQQRFGDAVAQLSRIVRSRPDHALTWLHLGDVAIYQGDEILAREHYQKIMEIKSAPADVLELARLRLANLKRLAADFRQTDRK